MHTHIDHVLIDELRYLSEIWWLGFYLR